MAGLTRLLLKSMIRPASGGRHGDVNRRIELTPNDLMTLSYGYIQRGLLFNKPNGSHVEHLKATLSQALDRLYPLAGRLVTTEHDGDTKTASFHVECNGAGAKFVHTEAVDGFTMADILNVPVVPMEAVNCLFPMSGVLNHQAAVSDLPLLAVQVTEFADGVFVAVSLNHNIADGTTFWDFINVWSELARGDSEAVSRRAGFAFGREYFDGVLDSPVRVPLPRPSTFVRPEPELEQQRVFRFSKEKIAELKAKANAAEPDGEISSLQAVMAHLWVCITRSRALKPEEIVCCLTAVGMRSRLRPPLPRFYVGNAIALPAVACAAGELLGRGMGWAARRINEAVAANASVDTRAFFDECAKRIYSPPDLAKIPRNVVAFTGSSRFDVYGNDFGWGRPVSQVNSLASNADGRMSICPGAEEGSIEFKAILLAKTFDALVRDPEFTQYFSS